MDLKKQPKNSYTLIKEGFIQNPGEPKFKKNILVRDDKIIAIADEILIGIQNLNVIDANGCIVTPGLIDQHIHGGYGCDFNTAEVKDILNFLANLPKHGVTSLCATIMTDRPEKIREQINKVKEAKESAPETSAKIVGVNLEGPFINPEYPGIHTKELCIMPSVENYKLIEDDEIKLITLAPELDNGFELTEYLTDKGIIVSAGHTKADEITAGEAFKAGVKQVTHIFNAMPPLHHRKPGIAGSALVNDEFYVEVIADHNHLHPDLIKLILRSKPHDKVIIISDSLPLNQSEQDSMVFGGHAITKKGEVAVNKDDRFAGSLMFLDSVIRKNLALAGFSRLLMYCSLNPARNLGLNNRAFIAENMFADLILWDKITFEIKNTLVNGKLSF